MHFGIMRRKHNLNYEVFAIGKLFAMIVRTMPVVLIAFFQSTQFEEGRGVQMSVRENCSHGVTGCARALRKPPLAIPTNTHDQRVRRLSPRKDLEEDDDPVTS